MGYWRHMHRIGHPAAHAGNHRAVGVHRSSLAAVDRNLVAHLHIVVVAMDTLAAGRSLGYIGLAMGRVAVGRNSVGIDYMGLTC